MARTRQKAKQRKAKRLEQERKAGGRTQPAAGVDERTAQANDDAVVEVEEAQLEAAAELAEAQEVEVGAGAEAARHAAAVEAAEAAEVATSGEVEALQEEESAPAKPTRRERRARREAREAEQRAKAETAAPRKDRAPAREAARKEPRRRGRVITFFIQMWAELRRVQWPNRNQLTQATAVVIVFCLIAGLYLGVWDWAFNKLVRWYL
jgi:preprotein translocase subunit SecE